MLDITFKQTDDELYELKAQFGKDVDPDALLASISSLIEMVKMTFPTNQQAEAVPTKTRKRRQAGVVERPGDAESIIANMPEANKALLVSLLEYEQEHSKPVDEIWDIKEYAQKFKAYVALMDGKNREQEVTALRYQLRLLRDRELLPSPPDRSLTPLGVDIAERLTPLLSLVEGHSVNNKYELEHEGQTPDTTTEEETVQEPAVQSSYRRPPFDHS